MSTAAIASKARSTAASVPVTPTQAAVDKARVAVVGETIRSLLVTLSQEERVLLRKAIRDDLDAKPQTPRAGPVLEKVVQLFQRERQTRAEWKVADLKTALEPMPARAIYNALAYLARKGRIKQVGYGRYYVMDYGFGIEAVGDDQPSLFGS